MPRAASDRLVLGIGNPDRGDDAVGPEVVRRLRGALPKDVVVAIAAGEFAGILTRLERAEVAYLVDACTSGAAAGSVLRFDVAAEPLPSDAFAMTTHGFGLAEAIELARALGQLPPHCIVFAVEGASFEPGAPLTPAVAEAVEEVAARLSIELGGQSCVRPTQSSGCWYDDAIGH